MVLERGSCLQYKYYLQTIVDFLDMHVYQLSFPWFYFYHEKAAENLWQWEKTLRIQVWPFQSWDL